MFSEHTKKLIHHILLLFPMVLALPLAMDIYVPAVPKLARLFHVSAGQMQLTLGMFMFVACSRSALPVSEICM